MQNVHLSPKDIARLLRVNESTIKRWVDSGMLPASKTLGGHRRVSQEDLSEFIKKRNLNSGRSYILKRSEIKKKSYSSSDYYGALYHGAYKEAGRDIISVTIAGKSVVDIIEEIMVPALIKIGEEWIAEKIDIADEHRMSFIVREHLVKISELLPVLSSKSPKAIIACVPGEDHEMALQMVSLALRQNGILPIVLGVNVPKEGIIRTALSEKASFICLTKVYAKTSGATQYVKELSLKLPKLKIIVGGSGWTDSDWQKIKNLKNLKRASKLSEIKDLVKKNN